MVGPTSWCEDACLALVGHSSSDGVTTKIPERLHMSFQWGSQKITRKIGVSSTHTLPFWFLSPFLTQWNDHVIKSI